MSTNKEIRNSCNHYEVHSRKYLEQMVVDFINEKQIVAHRGDDEEGSFTVKFAVKEKNNANK